MLAIKWDRFEYSKRSLLCNWGKSIEIVGVGQHTVASIIVPGMPQDLPFPPTIDLSVFIR
jgi:hypothetical protein